MLEKLRWTLTLWYIALSTIFYVALCAVAVFIFYSQLNYVIFENLKAQTREIRPAIDFSGTYPTLKAWAKTAESRNIDMMYTVQIYSPQGRLLEKYGPAGISTLAEGVVEGISAGHKLRVHSRTRELTPNGTLRGYLQVQESTLNRDEAIKQLLFTLGIMAPVLLCVLGLLGYILSQRAIRPTAEILHMLRNFTADTAHELNNPIALMQATVETIEKKYKDADLLDMLKNIHRGIDRLQDMSQKLFSLAAAENVNESKCKEEINLKEILDKVTNALNDSFKKKNISLVVDAAPDKKVILQSEALETILNNLIENALKYTEPNGSIKISLTYSGRAIHLTVEDSGIGISAESIPYIFNRFYRVKEHRAIGIRGIGLGLAIVKAIVQAHKGTINVESSVDKGTKFIVRLPVAAE